MATIQPYQIITFSSTETNTTKRGNPTPIISDLKNLRVDFSQSGYVNIQFSASNISLSETRGIIVYFSKTNNTNVNGSAPSSYLNRWSGKISPYGENIFSNIWVEAGQYYIFFKTDQTSYQGFPSIYFQKSEPWTHSGPYDLGIVDSSPSIDGKRWFPNEQYDFSIPSQQNTHYCFKIQFNEIGLFKIGAQAAENKNYKVQISYSYSYNPNSAYTGSKLRNAITDIQPVISGDITSSGSKIIYFWVSYESGTLLDSDAPIQFYIQSPGSFWSVIKYDSVEAIMEKLTNSVSVLRASNSNKPGITIPSEYIGKKQIIYFPIKFESAGRFQIGSTGPNSLYAFLTTRTDIIDPQTGEPNNNSYVKASDTTNTAGFIFSSIQIQAADTQYYLMIRNAGNGNNTNSFTIMGGNYGQSYERTWTYDLTKHSYEDGYIVDVNIFYSNNGDYFQYIITNENTQPQQSRTIETYDASQSITLLNSGIVIETSQKFKIKVQYFNESTGLWTVLQSVNGNIQEQITIQPDPIEWQYTKTEVYTSNLNSINKTFNLNGYVANDKKIYGKVFKIIFHQDGEINIKLQWGEGSIQYYIGDTNDMYESSTGVPSHQNLSGTLNNNSNLFEYSISGNQNTEVYLWVTTIKGCTFYGYTLTVTFNEGHAPPSYSIQRNYNSITINISNNSQNYWQYFSYRMKKNGASDFSPYSYIQSITEFVIDHLDWGTEYTVEVGYQKQRTDNIQWISPSSIVQIPSKPIFTCQASLNNSVNFTISNSTNFSYFRFYIKLPNNTEIYDSYKNNGNTFITAPHTVYGLDFNTTYIVNVQFSENANNSNPKEDCWIGAQEITTGSKPVLSCSVTGNSIRCSISNVYDFHYFKYRVKLNGSIIQESLFISTNPYQIQNLSFNTTYIIDVQFAETSSGTSNSNYWTDPKQITTDSQTPQPTGTSYVYIFNGSTWQKAIPYIFDGSSWRQAQAYIFDGTDWRKCVQ